MSTFKTGQRVVCVDAVGANSPSDPESAEVLPTMRMVCVIKDEIYTIREIELEDGSEWLTLEEVNHNVCFESHHFRPLQLDYNFVEEVIKQVTPKTVEI